MTSEAATTRKVFDWTAGERPVTLASAAHGHFDEPQDGARRVEDVLTVSGWCLFEGSRVSRVEMFMDGRVVGIARHHIDRHDVAKDFPDPDAPVAGFRGQIVMPEDPQGAERLVTIRATSLDGRQWISPTHRIRSVRRLATPADAELAAAVRRRNGELYGRIQNERSRVLVSTHDLSYGGGQLWLLDLLRHALAERQHDWMLIAQADGPLRSELEELGITVHIGSGPPVGSPASYEGHVHELALLFEAHSIGVVLANTLGTFPVVDAASRLGIPILWAIHESFPTRVHRDSCWGDRIHPYAAKRYDECFSLPNAVVFEAGQTADLFRELMPNNHGYIIDYGIEIDEIDRFRLTEDRDKLRRNAGFGPDDTIVLLVGTFEPRKAQGVVLAAFDELAAAHESAHLVLLGSHPGPYSDAIAEQARRSDHRDRVHIVPVGPDVYGWYQMADLLVCASDVESLPRSMLEAMAFQLPIVSTDVFGIPNIIEDGVTGWLTRANDLEGFVGTLHLVLRLPAEERHEVALRGRQLVEKRVAQEPFGRTIGKALEALLVDTGTDVASFLRRQARPPASGPSNYHRRAEKP